MIDLHKTFIKNYFSMMVLLHDQTEKLLKPFADNSPGMSDENKKFWISGLMNIKRAVKISRRLWTKWLPHIRMAATSLENTLKKINRTGDFSLLLINRWEKLISRNKSMQFENLFDCPNTINLTAWVQSQYH